MHGVVVSTLFDLRSPCLQSFPDTFAVIDLFLVRADDTPDSLQGRLSSCHLQLAVVGASKTGKGRIELRQSENQVQRQILVAILPAAEEQDKLLGYFALGPFFEIELLQKLGGLAEGASEEISLVAPPPVEHGECFEKRVVGSLAEPLVRHALLFHRHLDNCIGQGSLHPGFLFRVAKVSPEPVVPPR